jgi:ribosomal protein S18 acetylase RimI-like enzyme
VKSRPIRRSPRALWFGLLAHLGYRRLLILERPLATEVPPISSAVFDVRIVERSGAPAEFAAFTEARLVAVLFAAADGDYVPYLDANVPVGGGGILVSRLFVEPAYRRRGAATALLARCAAHYRGRGASRLVALVLPENQASAVLFRNLGFVETGRITVWRAFGRRRLLRRGTLSRGR